MQYILIWSFIVNSNWIAGSASFKTLDECLEAKSAISTYSDKKKDDYIECKLYDCEYKLK